MRLRTADGGQRCDRAPAAEEARFQDAIAQRELLVREVHHRIKNNLQGVAGLLQQIAARRPEVAGVINEAVGQVHAIAQVYGLQVGSSGPLRIRRVMEAIIGSVQRMSGRSISSRIEGPTEAQSQMVAARSRVDSDCPDFERVADQRDQAQPRQ
ncbi:histidine kinase dimerization/phosphoacceptor domain -containing protein [Roseateles sp. GG27B]